MKLYCKLEEINLNTEDDIKRLAKEFKSCQKALTAIGDETRQHIMLVMLESECSGSRVVEITEKTNLSRPAISHHMQILKDAGFVKVRKEGTKFYYYLDPEDSKIENLITLFQDTKKIMAGVPDRSEEE